MTDLTPAETKAIAALQRLAKTWPKSLWLFANGSTGLSVLKKKNGQRVTTDTGGMDQEYVVATVKIENDGGDW